MTRALTSFVLLFVFSISCQTSDRSKSGQAAELDLVNPEEVGMIRDSLAQIRELLRWAVDSQYVAGGVALVARDDKIVYFEAVGYQDRQKTDPMEKDDIFRIASMTKPIVTTALMQLNEQGKINVEDPVSKYIPEFANPMVTEGFSMEDSSYSKRPASREVTVHDLLTHTSGLGYSAFIPMARIVYASYGAVEGWTKDSVLLADNARKLGGYPLLHDPGARWTYGVSTEVVGRLVEVVSGQPLDEYLAKNIFAPLGMKDTYFYLPEEKADRLVDVWYMSNLPFENPSEIYGDDYPVAGAQTYFAGGAGLCSTAMDYLRFATALLNGGEWDGVRILKEETLQRMTSNQIGELSLDHGKFGYGLSVYTEDGDFGRRVGRFSWGGFWQTTFWVDPSRDLIGILMTNAQPTPVWNPLFDGFEEIVNGSVKEPLAAR